MADKSNNDDLQISSCVYTCTKAIPSHFSTSSAIVAAASSVFLRARPDISINTRYVDEDILISCCLVSHVLDSSFGFSYRHTSLFTCVSDGGACSDFLLIFVFASHVLFNI